MMALRFLAKFAIGLIAFVPSALADWTSKVEEIGFGEKSALAAAFGSGGGLSFGCESSKSDPYLRIITNERIADKIEGLSVEIEISVDGGKPSSFIAEVSGSRARTILINADLDADEARNVAELLSSAKRSIAFRAALGSKNFFTTTVPATGAKRAVQRALDTCVATKSVEPKRPLPQDESSNLSDSIRFEAQQLSKWYRGNLSNARKTEIERHLVRKGRAIDDKQVAMIDDCLASEMRTQTSELTVGVAIDRCDKRKR